ncbi:MAG: ParA family protein [Desulfovermiculus sp.]|nr:ParA family protein [Desulfovermiculus sp.]
MITIAVANQKGGVGKTTIAFNLTHILASRKKRILCVDNDAQAHLTGSFLPQKSDLSASIVQAYENKMVRPQKISKYIHLIGSDARLAQVTDGDIETIYLLRDTLHKLKAERAGYDYVIIDCLPSTSYIQMAALTAADYVLIPVKPAPYALKGMVDFLNQVEKLKKRLNPTLKILGIVINQADGRKPNLERDMEEALREQYGGLVFQTKVNKRVNVAASPAFQQPITAYEPKSPAAKEFRDLAKEVISRSREDI